LQTGIELRLKDKTKYAITKVPKYESYRGLPYTSNMIFKKIDYMCKKYFIPNSLALQQKLMSECLLYRVLLCKSNGHNMGFIEDDYEEPQILLNIALENCCGISVKKTWEKALFNMKLNWYSEEAIERICEQEINVKNVMELDSKKVLYGYGLRLCKMALDIAVMNGSNTVLENILQRFIDEQASVQNKTVSEQELDQASSFKISNPS
ncbi:8450_t:CDS:2, partial [Gigaspora rosea]